MLGKSISNLGFAFLRLLFYSVSGFFYSSGGFVSDFADNCFIPFLGKRGSSLSFFLLGLNSVALHTSQRSSRCSLSSLSMLYTLSSVSTVCICISKLRFFLIVSPEQPRYCCDMKRQMLWYRGLFQLNKERTSSTEQQRLRSLVSTPLISMTSLGTWQCHDSIGALKQTSSRSQIN